MHSAYVVCILPRRLLIQVRRSLQDTYIGPELVFDNFKAYILSAFIHSMCRVLNKEMFIFDQIVQGLNFKQN